MPRKPNSETKALTIHTLAESAPWAAQHLKLIIKGEIKTTPARLEACKYVIDQHLGRPAQKNILAGDKDSPLKVAIIVETPNGQVLLERVLAGERTQRELPEAKP